MPLLLLFMPIAALLVVVCAFTARAAWSQGVARGRVLERAERTSASAAVDAAAVRVQGSPYLQAAEVARAAATSQRERARLADALLDPYVERQCLERADHFERKAERLEELDRFESELEREIRRSRRRAVRS